MNSVRIAAMIYHAHPHLAILVTQFSLLASRRLLPLIITQFLGACNDNIFKNALIIFIVFHIAEQKGLNATMFVALASGLFVLPFFLFSITAGQIADKYIKSKLIIKIKFLEVILMPCAALGFYLNHLPLLLAVLFLLGTQASFFGPLKYAILPELLHKNELIFGNSFIESSTFIAILLGTIMGTILILYPHGEHIVTALMIGLAVLGWISSWYIPLSTLEDPKLSINFKLFTILTPLFQSIYKKKDIFLSILGISWFWFFGATLLAIFPQFTKEVLHADAKVVGFFMQLFAIGLALGSGMYALFSKKKIRADYIFWSLLGMTFLVIDILLSTNLYSKTQPVALISFQQFIAIPHHYHIILDFWLLAVLGGFYTVPLYTLIQKRANPAQRARVIAFNNIMNALCMLLSALMLMGFAMIGSTMLLTFSVLALGSSCLTFLLYHYRHRLLP